MRRSYIEKREREERESGLSPIGERVETLTHVIRYLLEEETWRIMREP